MEIHHWKRETYYIHLEDPEEFKKWVEQIRTCCWRVEGFKNKDPVHTVAYQKAIADTRNKLGRWGYWSYGGTEEQVLSDLIAEEIDWTIMGRVYSKIQGPWSVRWAIRNQVLKAIDKMVMAAVTPAWKAMDTTVTQLRPQIEPKIKEGVEPIGKLKREMMDKVKDQVMSIIKPALEEKVVPHLSKIVDVIRSPMTEAFGDSYKLYDNEAIAKYEVKPTADENKKNFRDLDYFPHSWKMYDITRQADAMYDPLWALNIIFTEIYPWSLIWSAHDTLRGTMDNAIYTYQQKLLEAIEKGEEKDMKALSDNIRNMVLADYQHDGKLATTIYFREILKEIVMPPFNAVVIPLSGAILDPMNDQIPDPMKQFLDLNDMFQDILNGVIDDSIDVCLGGSK